MYWIEFAKVRIKINFIWNLEQKFKYSDFMTWIKLDFKVQFISDYKAGYDN